MSCGREITELLGVYVEWCFCRVCELVWWRFGAKWDFVWVAMDRFCRVLRIELSDYVWCYLLLVEFDVCFLRVVWGCYECWACLGVLG